MQRSNLTEWGRGWTDCSRSWTNGGLHWTKCRLHRGWGRCGYYLYHTSFPSASVINTVIPRKQTLSINPAIFVYWGKGSKAMSGMNVAILGKTFFHNRTPMRGKKKDHLASIISPYCVCPFCDTAGWSMNNFSTIHWLFNIPKHSCKRPNRNASCICHKILHFSLAFTWIKYMVTSYTTIRKTVCDITFSETLNYYCSLEEFAEMLQEYDVVEEILHAWS